MRSPFWFLNLPFLAAASLGADFATGVSAYQKGDYATAAKEWRPLAEQGSPEAQFNLGLLYADGQGGPQDYSEAITRFQRSAAPDHANAQQNLGTLYHSGQGGKRD